MKNIKNIEKFITKKVFVLEHFGFHHWKGNYLIELPYEYHAEEHTVGLGAQFSHKKMENPTSPGHEKRSKTYFDFFPTINFNV